MTPIIRANTCRTCKFSEPLPPEAQGMLQCRRYPPAAGPLLVPIKPGINGVQIHGGFVPVQPDWHCGEHKPRLAVIENQMPQQQAQDGKPPFRLAS